MADYIEMYSKLFNKITDIIEELRLVQQQTEELYIQSKEFEIILLERDSDEKITHLQDETRDLVN